MYKVKVKFPEKNNTQKVYFSKCTSLLSTSEPLYLKWYVIYIYIAFSPLADAFIQSDLQIRTL